MKKNIMKVAAAVLAFSMLFGSAAFAEGETAGTGEITETAAAETTAETAAAAAEPVGWKQTGREWFYWLDENSVAKNQWIPNEDGAASYWVKDNGVMAASEWVSYDNAWYYVNSQGIMEKDAMVKLDNDTKYYYLDENGVMLTNSWKEIEGDWYYFQADGTAVMKKWYNIDGDDYYFLANGKMARDAVVGGGHVGADGKRTR